MPKDLEIIRALEKKYDLKLEQADELYTDEYLRGYVLDDEGYVVELQLDGIELDKWSFLEELTRLTSLAFCDNGITDWSFLTGLTNLTNLNLTSNGITDGSFLTGLANLTDLNLSGNEIEDVEFLRALTRLKRVNLRGNSYIA